MAMSDDRSGREWDKFVEDGDGNTCVRIYSSGGTGGKGTSSPSLTADYKSPADFTASYTSGTTITLSQVPINISNTAQIKYIMVVPVTGDSMIYVNGSGGITIRHAEGVLTVSGADTDPFTVGDAYEVGINGPSKHYDLGLDVSKVINQAPDSNKYVNETFIDETNLVAGTAYFPSNEGFSMDGFKHLSLTGSLIDANAVTKIEVEVTNDLDLSIANWYAIGGINPNTGTLVMNYATNSSTVNFIWLFENMFYSSVRFKITTADATNTVFVSGKRLY